MTDATLGTQHCWRRSFETAWPVVMGYFAVAFVFGLAAVSAHYPLWFPVAMCLFVYAGASQFAALALLATQASIGTIILTTFLINARHLLMSMYMSKALEDSALSRMERAIYALGLTDESFAMHSNTLAREGRLSFAYLVSFNGYCHVAWILGAVAGGLVSQFALQVSSFKLDYALTAMMLFVLTSLCGSGLKLIVAFVAIVATCLMGLVLDTSLALLLATLISCGAGLCLKTFISPPSSD